MRIISTRQNLLTISLTIALILVTTTPPAVAAQPAPPAGQAAHYFVFEKSGTTVLPLWYRQVQLLAPLSSLNGSQLAAAQTATGRDKELLIVEIQSDDGRSVYQNIVEVPRWLRGEFHGQVEGAAIDGHFFPHESSAFVVRVPAIKASILVLSDANKASIARFVLSDLIAQTPKIRSEGWSQQLEMTPSAAFDGDPANRVDVLFMGDGYTAQQVDQFNTHMTNIASSFFAITPLSEYINYFNLHTLFVPSTESGSDHPPYLATCSPYNPSCCGDPLMLSDPLQGTFADTAFNGRFCAMNIHRLLVVDYGLVYAAAALVPDWDAIIVSVNDTTYGGSGGSLSVSSTHPLASQIIQHEFGHSFARLADEYESAYPGYPSCSDIVGPACEANVTDIAVRDQIKWAPWIDPSTPIPTPEYDPAYSSVVGLFEGARYLATGMYRSGQNCLMRALGRPFCQVPSQTFVLRLYSGGWGTPAEGISMIEPGTASPASSMMNLIHPASQDFQVTVLEPTGGPPAATQWWISGTPVPGATAANYTFVTNASMSGLIGVKLTVDDATTLVHPAMAGDQLSSEHNWTVNVLDWDRYDVSNDNLVTVRDIQLVAGAFGDTVPPFSPAYDLWPDGVIDIKDVSAAATCWQRYSQ